MRRHLLALRTFNSLLHSLCILVTFELLHVVYAPVIVHAHAHIENTMKYITHLLLLSLWWHLTSCHSKETQE